MNYDWIKVNRARNGFVLSWPDVKEDGTSVLEHRVIEARPGDTTGGLASVLTAVSERFKPGFSWTDWLVSR